MPNFSVNEGMIHRPVWVENPTDKHHTWRYDSEYTTFVPGFFRNLETNELWAMDQMIAIHFQRSIPELVIHTTRPTVEMLSGKKEEGEKTLQTMTMQELRAYGKGKGHTFKVGITKEDLVKELEAL